MQKTDSKLMEHRIDHFLRLTNADGTPRAKGTVKTMTVRVSTKEVENMILESLDIATPQPRDVR